VVELELDVVVEGEPFHRDEPWHRERYRRTIYVPTSRTLLIGGEAMYRTDTESLDDLSVHSVRL
jgi:hypothetical protein